MDREHYRPSRSRDKHTARTANHVSLLSKVDSRLQMSELCATRAVCFPLELTHQSPCLKIHSIRSTTKGHICFIRTPVHDPPSPRRLHGRARRQREPQPGNQYRCRSRLLSMVPLPLQACPRRQDTINNKHHVPPGCRSDQEKRLVRDAPPAARQYRLQLCARGILPSYREEW